MGIVVACCPLCNERRVRVVAEQPNLVVFACDACFAQFTVNAENVVRIERRRVSRDRDARVNVAPWVPQGSS